MQDVAGLAEEPVERRREDRRRAAVPVPVDRRRADRRAAARLERPAAGPGSSAVVVDEWPLVRAGVVQVLADLGVATAVEAARAGEALRDPAGRGAAIAVLGLHDDLPRIDAARVLKAREPAPRILVLLDRTDAAEVKGLVAADVEGLLLRTVTQEDLRAAAERVVAGQRVLAGPVLQVLATAGLDLATPSTAPGGTDAASAAAGVTLTGKEQEVLRGLARGESTRAIAEALHVSAATVKTHLSNLYAKLGVDSRQRAVAVAVERGLLR